MNVSAAPLRFGKLIYDREKAAQDLGADSAGHLNRTLQYLLQPAQEWNKESRKFENLPGAIEHLEKQGFHFQVTTGKVNHLGDELRKIDFRLLNLAGNVIKGSQNTIWARDLNEHTVKQMISYGLEAHKNNVAEQAEALKKIVGNAREYAIEDFSIPQGMEIKTTADLNVTA